MFEIALNKNHIYDKLKNTNIILNTPKVFFPFGIENFNGKLILNVELDLNQDNESYNFFVSYLQIDENIKKIVGKDIKSNIKYRESKKVHLRVHLKKETEIMKKNSLEICSFSDLKKKYGYIDLELGNLWTYGSNIGFTVYAKRILIDDSN
jgi:hypothetical protein